MSDPEATATPAAEDASSPMEPQAQAQDPKAVDTKEETAKLSNLTLRIWPPTQRTRDAVIKRLIETLSTPSVLSKRYGTISEEEAAAAARSIEEEAFSVAGAAFSPEDDGIEILQIYSREISKRMLDAAKARAGPAAAPSPSDSTSQDAAGGEEVTSSVKAEATA